MPSGCKTVPAKEATAPGDLSGEGGSDTSTSPHAERDQQLKHVLEPPPPPPDPPPPTRHLIAPAHPAPANAIPASGANRGPSATQPVDDEVAKL
eukprot:317628_1